MKPVIRAIYKNGVLNPITPVNNLPENDIVDLEISPAPPANIVSEKEAIQMLVNMGILIPPPHKDDIPQTVNSFFAASKIVVPLPTNGSKIILFLSL